MMTTEDMIKSRARQLFNEQGIDRVTMRAIAAACGIAVGNLTYYFPKKASIVDALMADAFSQTLPETPIGSLDDVTLQFSRMLDTLRHNAFYFLDDRFLVASRGRNQIIRRRFLEGFDRLIAAGDLSPAFTKETQIALLDVMMMTHMTWLRNTVRASAITKEELLRLHWAVLAPYLTEKGKARLSASARFPI